jgi:hypothetical protein
MTNKALTRDSPAADDGPGACYITDQQSGQQKCHFITKSECDQRGGTFFGGLCPPIGSEADLKLMAKGVAAEQTKKTEQKAPAKKKKKQRKNKRPRRK